MRRPIVRTILVPRTRSTYQCTVDRCAEGRWVSTGAFIVRVADRAGASDAFWSVSAAIFITLTSCTLTLPIHFDTERSLTTAAFVTVQVASFARTGEAERGILISAISVHNAFITCKASSIRNTERRARSTALTRHWVTSMALSFVTLGRVCIVAVKVCSTANTGEVIALHDAERRAGRASFMGRTVTEYAATLHAL